VRTPTQNPEHLPKETLDLAQQASVFAAMSVWYALLYVVIEGYRELECKDENVDRLLSQDEYVQTLRRFRNAIFHYQEDPLPKKLFEFLMTEDSEKWISGVNRALKSFLERNLRIGAIFRSQQS
jgi:hypothetical protein